MSRYGPCLCGDIYCGSCGPAQGNYKCHGCGQWTFDFENPSIWRRFWCRITRRQICGCSNRYLKELERQEYAAYLDDLEEKYHD